MATAEQFLEVQTNRYMALQDAVNSVFGADKIGLVPDPGTPSGNVLYDTGWGPPFSITPGSITNADLADMTQGTIKGRAAGAGTGSPQDLSATQATAILNAFTGDSGSGGVKGLVPAPAAGDAAAGKFLKADGTFALPGSGLTLLTSGSPTAITSLDLDLTSYTSYRGLLFILTGLVPVTDATFLTIQFSNDGGANWINTGYNYAWWMIVDNGTNVSIGASGQTAIRATATNANVLLSNASGEGATYMFNMLAQADTSFFPKILGSMSYFSNGLFGSTGYGQGMNEVASDVDAIRFIINSGNIAQVSYAIYGYS